MADTNKIIAELLMKYFINNFQVIYYASVTESVISIIKPCFYSLSITSELDEIFVTAGNTMSFKEVCEMSFCCDSSLCLSIELFSP